MKYAAVLFDWGDTLTALEGDMPVPLPWIGPVLKKLYYKSYRLGIITNTYRYQDGWYVRNVLAGLNLLQYFEVFISSGTYGIHKPDSKIFKKAMNFLEVPASKILMVGDSERCDGACQRVGMSYMKVDKFENWESRLYEKLDDSFPNSRKLSILAEYELATGGWLKTPLVHLSEPLAVGDSVVIDCQEYQIVEACQTLTGSDILDLKRKKEFVTFRVVPV